MVLHLGMALHLVLGMSYIPADAYSNLAYLESILAMGVLPLLPTVTVPAAAAVAATMILAATATLQAVLLRWRWRCQQHLRRLIPQALPQAPRHTALLPMVPAPRAGAAAVNIITVSNVSSLVVFIYPS
jgi:hypothetical protein